MYYCRDCCAIFEEPRRFKETHGFKEGPFEERAVCPKCGSNNYDDAAICDRCGDYYAAPDAVEHSLGTICPDCADDLDEEGGDDNGSDNNDGTDGGSILHSSNPEAGFHEEIASVGIDIEAMRELISKISRAKHDEKAKVKSDADKNKAAKAEEAAILDAVAEVRASFMHDAKEKQYAAAIRALEETVDLLSIFYKALRATHLPRKLCADLCMQLHTKLLGG